jgi:hypothetical protein
MVVRLSGLRTGRPYPQEILLLIDPRAIVRSEGIYVYEKYTNKNWDRTSDIRIVAQHLNQFPSNMEKNNNLQRGISYTKQDLL